MLPNIPGNKDRDLAFKGPPQCLAVKNPPAMQELQEMWVQSLGQEDPLVENMAAHSSLLAWRIPMDRGAWWATVHRLSESQILLKQFSMHTLAFKRVKHHSFFFFFCCDIVAVHGVLQARILEWVAITFSRGYSHPRD